MITKAEARANMDAGKKWPGREASQEPTRSGRITATPLTTPRITNGDGAHLKATQSDNSSLSLHSLLASSGCLSTSMGQHMCTQKKMCIPKLSELGTPVGTTNPGRGSQFYAPPPECAKKRSVLVFSAMEWSGFELG